MATQLTISGTASGNATLVGAWELRAGSADSAEWLDGAADVAYPGGGPGTFNASNSDGANGYDPAPKMALITLGSTTDYQAKAITKFEINKNEIIERLEVSEKFNYQKISDSYEEKSYEQTIKKNLASSISQKLILRLSRTK